MHASRRVHRALEGTLGLEVKLRDIVADVRGVLPVSKLVALCQIRDDTTGIAGGDGQGSRILSRGPIGSFLGRPRISTVALGLNMHVLRGIRSALEETSDFEVRVIIDGARWQCRRVSRQVPGVTAM